MSNYYGNNFGNEAGVQSRTGGLSQVSTNAFLTRVFAIMSIGLLLTAVTAMGVASQGELMKQLFTTGLKWVVMLAPLAVVFLLSATIHKMSSTAAAGVFGLYSVLVGVSLSAIFWVYTASSIASTFFISAGMFGAMAFIGATTKRDLSKLGSILIMALVGIMIASLINIFLKSSMMSWIMSLIAVPIFCGLTAWDMQKLMDQRHAYDGSEWAKKAALIGALELYMDFIGIFVNLLRLLGSRD